MSHGTLSAGLWIILVASGVLAAPGYAQTARTQNLPQKPRKQLKSPPSVGRPKTDGPRGEERGLPAKVVDALRVLAGESKAWAASVAAVDVQSQVADLIWEADTDAAQNYLALAWETAGRVEEKQQGASKFRNTSSRSDARRRVLLIARKRWPRQAEKWLAEMEQGAETEQSGGARGVFDDRTQRSAVLLQMAMSVVARDPRAAAELALESLRDGVSFGLQGVLLAIQEKDFGLAQSVFRAALTKLRTSGGCDPDELLILAAYLYTPGRVFGANTTENRGQFSMAVDRNRPALTAAAVLNPGLSQEFLRLAADLLINAPLPSTTASPQQAARKQISAIGFLLGRISRQAPERAEALRQKVRMIEADARFSSTAPPPPADVPTRYEGESPTDYAERRVDLMEESAGKETNPLARNIAYARAALATEAERYERGLDLARRIQDETLRDGVTNLLIYRATLHLINSNRIDLAYELTARNGDPAQRAASLVLGGRRLAKAKEFGRATQWLEEARKLCEKADDDEAWRHIALGIVSTYAEFDAVLALGSLSDAIEMFERSPGVAIYEEKAPLIKRFSGLPFSDFTHGTSGFGLNSAMTAFGPEQFDEVLVALNRIKRPEIRGVAVISLCRGYLQAKQRRPSKADGSPSTTAEKTTASPQW